MVYFRDYYYLQAEEQKVYKQMFTMYSKVNSDFMNERVSLEMNTVLIQEALSDPLNIYVLSGKAGSSQATLTSMQNLD